MINRIADLQRQIELAAAVYEHPGRYSEGDLASQFFVSVSTIRRDVRALRDMGVDIRSRKLAYQIAIDVEKLNFLITSYMTFWNSEKIKNLPMVVERLKNRTLSFFVETMRSIREKRVMEIEYRSTRRDKPSWRTLTPVTFYNTGKSYYLIAVHGDTPKFFAIERITQVRFSRERSPLRQVPSLTELFRYSWGSFTGGSVTEVRLRFKDDLSGYLSERFWVEGQVMRQTEEGFEVTLKVKLSNEFVAWVMGWGEAVTILGPRELKEKVLGKAEGLLRSHGK